MKKQHEIKMNLKGLEDIKKAVGDTFITRVGVLGGKAQRKDEKSDMNNAEIMLVHMFGSIANNIPARDPLYAYLIRHRRDLIRKIGTGQMKAAFEAGDYKRMFELLGTAAEEIVQKAFETAGDGLWPDISEETKRRKGSSSILIDTQQLRRSVSSDVVKKSGNTKSIQHVGIGE